jgi:anti-sigma regulatory factor (Ser/Thr protein kinase)
VDRSQASAISLPSEFVSVQRARQWVADRLCDVDGDVRDDVVLAASELVTNAVRHGLGGDVRVEVSAVPSLVTLSVTSRAAPVELPVPESWTQPSPAAESGRGLAIVRQVSSRVEVDHRDGSVTVRVVRDRPPVPDVRATDRP